MAAMEHLTPVTLELGGKDPAVILPGTDLNRWASLWMRGILYAFLLKSQPSKFTRNIAAKTRAKIVSASNG